MNIPNLLTIARIIIAFVAPFVLINGTKWERILAGIFCFIAILTDWLDGWYARKYNKITNLGKILDPIADKALILISFSVFVYLDVIAIWWVIPIFVREILVTVYRFLFLSKNIVIAAAKSGKIKTVVQMITLGMVYFVFMLKKHFSEYFSDSFPILLYLALSLTVLLTIESGYLFFKNNWEKIKKYHEIA